MTISTPICVRSLQTKLIGSDNSCASVSIFSIQNSKPTSDSAKGGAKMVMDLCEVNGLSNRHIHKLACELFKILSVFSPIIFSTKEVALGHPRSIQSAN